MLRDLGKLFTALDLRPTLYILAVCALVRLYILELACLAPNGIQLAAALAPVSCTLGRHDQFSSRTCIQLTDATCGGSGQAKR
jgi:hypothetical protein